MRSSNHRSLVLLSTMALLLAACDGIGLIDGERGSGELVSETRELAPFTGIVVSSAIVVDMTVDPAAAQSVTVTYDDNILENVVTRVDSGVLVLELQGNVNLTGRTNRSVTVTMNDVTLIEVSGASDVVANGSAGSYELNASGASQVDLSNLKAVDIQLDVSGASNVDVFATGTVSGSASGASDLRVLGPPASALIDSSGATTVDIVD